MRKITIEAASPESARYICDALARFRPTLLDDGERHPSVAVSIRSHAELLEILNALAKHLADRGQGPAVIGLDGHNDQLDAAPSSVLPLDAG